MKKIKLSHRLICERCEKLVFSPDVWEVKYGLCKICLHAPITSEEYFDELFHFELFPHAEQ